MKFCLVIEIKSQPVNFYQYQQVLLVDNLYPNFYQRGKIASIFNEFHNPGLFKMTPNFKRILPVAQVIFWLDNPPTKTTHPLQNVKKTLNTQIYLENPLQIVRGSKAA